MSDSKKPDEQPAKKSESADASRENGKETKVTRKTLSSDPTMPIKLDRSMFKKPLPGKPNPAATAPTEPGVPVLKDETAPAAKSNATTGVKSDGKSAKTQSGDEWLGTEQTMVGLPKPTTTKIKIASMDEGEDWLGREATMMPTSRPSADAAAEAKAKDKAAEEWLGNESTMVGMPAPKMTPPGGAAGADEEWVGREATMLGMQAGGGDLSIETPADKKQGSTTSGSRTGSGTRGTSPAMDDGWHLKGKQGPLTGKSLNDYEIGGILGQGGMGTVYRARQISLKRRVALKVLPPHLSHDPNLRSRFEQEARTASLLNTPHVVQVFAAGCQGDEVYFVMEYVEGTDLSEIINEKKARNEKMTAEESAGYILQAARGLAEAGKHNIVHRDIKPPNLMVTTKGVVKIADFGISKVTGEQGMTMTGTAVGTPAYCSPEQGRGDLVDCRADIYSLGVVFFELLTGQKPFDGTTANALIYQHNYAEPPLPTSIDASISEQYQAVVMKCLQKDPAKRYQDAAELVTDLERIRDGSMSLTAVFSAKFGTGADEAMSRYLGVKKRRMWPLVAASLLVLGGGGGGYYYYSELQEKRHVDRAELDLVTRMLSPLNLAAPVPASADGDLKKLARLKGEKDADVIRYTVKLKKVRDLQARLARLDAVDTVPAALRSESEKDLDGYQDLVGTKGADIARWGLKLEAARADAAQLRTTLAEIDSAAYLTVAMRERLDPGLTRLKALVGEGDGDVQRWTTKFADFQERLTKLKASLAALDAPDAVIGEAQVARLASELESLRLATGGSDADAQRWQDKLAQAGERIARLRKSLTRLDGGGDYVTTALHVALGADLDEYKGLVDAGDPELKRWLTRVHDSVEYVKQLRVQLAPLDQPEALMVSDHPIYQSQLERLRVVVGEDDGQVKSWTRKLGGAKDFVSGLRVTLARLEKDEPLKVEEQDACEKALASLDAIGGLSSDQKRFYARRLGEERQRVKELRDDLAAKAASDQNISEALVDEIDRLAALVGEQDPDVKVWRGKAATYTRLRKALIVLDSAQPIPSRAEAMLDEFAKIVGEGDDKIILWRAKIALVSQLRRDLADLDKVVPLPQDAGENVGELARQVGTEEPDVKRWRAKVDRVAALRTALSVELRDTYILPSEAPRRAAELLTLIGSSEQDVKRWAIRVAVLQGPTQPSWATHYGRDQYGPWAELTIKGATQRFRYVPSGTFTMGSPDKERGRDKDEPRVKVTLTQSYWLADSECTQGFFVAVAGNTHDSRFRGTDKPVDRISWEDCHRFLNTLNGQVAKLEAKLPTEAQWEYAARGGCDAPYSSYQGALEESKLETIGWFAKNATSGTKDVKRRFPNVLGLHDMYGNLWEWCEDRYGNYSPTPVEDWIGREEENHVARGGSWGDQPSKLRAANRLSVKSDMRTVYIGFRLAVPVEWPEGKAPGQGEITVSATDHPYQPFAGDDTDPSAAPSSEPTSAPPASVPENLPTTPASTPAASAKPVAAPVADAGSPAAAPAVDAKQVESWRAALASAMTSDASLESVASSVTLEVPAGVPTLRGRVATNVQKQKASIFAFRATGGKKVANELVVGPEPVAVARVVEPAKSLATTEPVTAPVAVAPNVNPAAAAPVAADADGDADAKRLDSWRASFAADLKADGELSAHAVRLDQEHGSLVVRGSVDTAQQKQKAGLLAFRATHGTRVLNELEIGSPHPLATSAIPAVTEPAKAAPKPESVLPAAPTAAPAVVAPAPSGDPTSQKPTAPEVAPAAPSPAVVAEPLVAVPATATSAPVTVASATPAQAAAALPEPVVAVAPSPVPAASPTTQPEAAVAALPAPEAAPSEELARLRGSFDAAIASDGGARGAKDLRLVEAVGAVVVRGTVRDAAERNRIGLIAFRVSGKRIVNQLAVAP